MAVAYVIYGGKKYSPEFRDALIEAKRLLALDNISIIITQGGFNRAVKASADTHSGDAVDISVRNLSLAKIIRVITVLRMVGIAASFRTTKVSKYGVHAQGFSSYHIHGVPNGWGRPSPGAKRQIAYTDRRGVKHGYRNGRDGLKGNFPDVGPGHTHAYYGRTWEGYKSAKNAATSANRAYATVKPKSIGSIPRVSTAKPWPAVTVDGVLGSATLRRLQMQLNVAVTGKLDHYTIRALKVWLGNADDGKGVLSPFNVRQLQYRVGMRGSAQDGILGPATKRLLQRYLNENR